MTTSEPLAVAAPFRLSGRRDLFARVVGGLLILYAAVLLVALAAGIYGAVVSGFPVFRSRILFDSRSGLVGPFAGWVSLAAIFAILGFDIALRRRLARRLHLAIAALALFQNCLIASFSIDVFLRPRVLSLSMEFWFHNAAFAGVALAFAFIATLPRAAAPERPVAALDRPGVTFLSRAAAILLAEVAVLHIFLWTQDVRTLFYTARSLFFFGNGFWNKLYVSTLFHQEEWWYLARALLANLSWLGIALATIAAAWGLASGRGWGRRLGLVVSIAGFAVTLGGQLWIYRSLAAGPLHVGATVFYGLALLYCLAPRLRWRRKLAAPAPEPEAAAGAEAEFPASAIPDDENWREALLASLRETGVQRAPQDPLLGLILPVLGMIVVTIAWAIASTLARTIAESEEMPGDAALLIQVISVTVAAIVIQPFLSMLLRRLWQFRAKSAEAELERAGSRRPILYLRSFALDEAMTRPSVLDVLLGVRRVTTEQMLAKVLGRCGPVIAIGRPEEKLPGLGAARFYVSHDLWRQKIADAAKASRLVVWTTGVSSEGLRWEIDFLLKSLPPEKLLVWTHPQLLDLTRSERQQEWSLFLGSIGKRFPHPLPERLGRARFIRFAPDWQPVPIAATWGRFGWLLRPWRKPQTVALKALLRERGIPPYDPEAVRRRRRRIRLVVGIAAAIVAAAALTLGTLFWIDHSQRQARIDARAWDRLADELLSADTITDYQAEGGATRRLAEFDSVRSDQRWLMGYLEDKGWFADTWGDVSWRKLAELRPIAAAYVAIFETAEAEPLVTGALVGKSPVVGVADTGDAARRRDAVSRLIASVERFLALWATVPKEAVFVGLTTGAKQLAARTEARLAVLEGDRALLDFLATHPGVWQAKTMPNGQVLPEFSDSTPDAQFWEIFAKRNEAVAELSRSLSED